MIQQKYKVIQHEFMGKIVVATDHYTQNELVCVSKQTAIVPFRDTHSVQISEQTHVHIDEPGQLFSHSCEPNLYVADNEFGAYNFYATRDIQAGERLAFHYGTTEAYSISVPICLCDTKGCIGKSIGFKEASADVQAYLYQVGVATYLRKWYDSIKETC